MIGISFKLGRDARFNVLGLRMALSPGKPHSTRAFGSKNRAKDRPKVAVGDQGLVFSLDIEVLLQVVGLVNKTPAVRGEVHRSRSQHGKDARSDFGPG